MAGRVQGKVAFVTGAARGQGRAHALRLAEEGADIIAIDVAKNYDSMPYEFGTAAELEETAALVRGLGRRVLARTVDIRDLPAMQNVVNDGIAEFGKLDVVVGNAAINKMEWWNEITPESWRDVIDTNLTGAWHTALAAAPHMVENGGGSIILIGSAGALKAFVINAHYIAAKHGVVGLARALALELGQFNVRVNTVHPGGVDTTLGAQGMLAFGRVDNPVLRGRMSNVLGGVEVDGVPAPIGELMQPRDIADAVLFLASDESKWITGLELKVDAGLTV